ncbi:MAG: GNAT family N-acetyltransferase [Oscillospiraceae bacterium]|nr:MAG: GNAT family N-acetyltransferase [Oscillospiraceae bacterium]
MHAFFVAKELQRCGAGTFALHFAEQYAKENGFDFIVASVDKNNTAAGNCFLKCGYTASEQKFYGGILQSTVIFFCSYSLPPQTLRLGRSRFPPGRPSSVMRRISEMRMKFSHCHLSSVICHLSSVIKLVSFYIAYAGGAIIGNIFIGLGKTGDTAVNSLANFS